MKITVHVKPNARVKSIEQVNTCEYVVKVPAPPVEGRANEAVIELLSEHFDVPKSAITIHSGHRGKRKVFEIRLNS